MLYYRIIMIDLQELDVTDYKQSISELKTQSLQKVS